MHAPRTELNAAAVPKLACFEAIRGLAAFSVLVGHFLLGFWPSVVFLEGLGWREVPAVLRFLARFPGKFLWNGPLAVSIFFVLSGFVLSLAYFQKGSAPALGSAATRRYPRLMIPVAASVLLAFALLQTGVMFTQDAVQHMNEVYGLPPQTDFNGGNGFTNKWLAVYYNFLPDFRTALSEGTWGAFSGVVTYNPVLWTMTIELTGSFLVYCFLALFGSLRNRWLLYGLCGGMLLWTERIFLLDFLLGMALCDLWVQNQRSWQWSLGRVPALLLIGVALFLLPWKPLAAVLVVGAAAVSPRVQELLEGRWLALLGRLSFSLYLVHMVIFSSLGCGLYLILCRDLGWSHFAGSATAGLAATVGSFLTAWIFYHLVDRPAIALTRWLDIWLFRPRATAAAVPTILRLSRAA